MKSFILSIIIGTLLIIGSLMYTHSIIAMSNHFSDQAGKIYEMIDTEQFDEAEKLSKSLTKHYNSKKILLAATGNHQEMNDIDMYLNEMKEFIGEKSKADALANCKVLKILFEKMPENYRFRAENIL